MVIRVGSVLGGSVSDEIYIYEDMHVLTISNVVVLMVIDVDMLGFFGRNLGVC